MPKKSDPIIFQFKVIDHKNKDKELINEINFDKANQWMLFELFSCRYQDDAKRFFYKFNYILKNKAKPEEYGRYNVSKIEFIGLDSGKKSRLKKKLDNVDSDKKKWEQEVEENEIKRLKKEAIIMFEINANGKGSNYKYRDGVISGKVVGEFSLSEILFIFREVKTYEDFYDGEYEHTKEGVTEYFKTFDKKRLEGFCSDMMIYNYEADKDSFSFSGRDEVQYGESDMLYWLPDWNGINHEEWHSDNKFTDTWVEWWMSFEFPALGVVIS